MTQKKQFKGLDYFKIAAAFLVVAIHTSPLASLNEEADFVLTRVIARTAVPFFFMVTGYFLLPQYLFRHSMDRRPLVHTLKKQTLLYLAAVLLYLPINLYAGHFGEVSVGGFFRMLFIDGTFYHLWYLPAVFSGIVIVWFLGMRLPFEVLAGIAVVLYAVGLFGDSYYGLTAQIPFFKKLYDVIFSVSSYTRNGLFYGPVFLVMGAEANRRTHENELRGKRGIRSEAGVSEVVNAVGLAVSLTLMSAEGLLLRKLNLQRHDSMYVLLPPVMFFLFRGLLSWGKRQRRNRSRGSTEYSGDVPLPGKGRRSGKRLRSISTWIYMIHPLCIILVRGAAKAAHTEKVFVENSLMHYLAVCAVSCVGACIITGIAERTEAYRRILGEEPCFVKGRAWIELSRENLAMNVDSLQGLLLPGQELMPAVKADAYGHGAGLIAEELNSMGIQNFCVACVSEGVSLRKNGITGDILILGYTHPKDFPLLGKYRLTQTVVDYAYGRVLNGYGKKIKVHVKVDTGMRRLGERAEKIKEISRIFRLKNLEIDGIYTHLCADETRDAGDAAFTKGQTALFYEVVKKLEQQGISGLKTHLLASYGLLNYPESGGDYVRVGIALYGLLSDNKEGKKRTGDETGRDRSMPKLNPVLSLRARIAAVKEVYPGESIGYGCSYVAEDTRKTAVLAIGYADGLPRSLSGGKGRVLIHGQSAPVLGRICMDQTIVDITEIPNVKAGEIATVIGRSGDQEITAYELAENAGTITNEIFSRLGGRLQKVMI